jgi:omega-6 fatty acid desaturase (delta-12 desaturase)
MLLAVVLPFVVWNFLFSVVTFLQHTHPQLVWFQREQDWTFLKAQIGGTVHVVFPWPLNRLAHSIMEHPAHHALPAIPLYHLREAQQRLSSAFPGQTIRFDWSLREHLDIQRRCKLYDYENYRWVDYSGQPTS